jgi:hypothetical protein
MERGDSIRFRGDHPLAGQIAHFFSMEKTHVGERPKVRCRDGHFEYLWRAADFEIVEAEEGRRG